MRPDFLPVPDRTAKPRSVGLTHVLDKGMATPDVRVMVDRAGHLIDIWKLGWGTAYLEPDVGEKVAILQRAGVRACVGGTLLEAAWAAGVAEQCLAWAAEMGFSCVEVSNGAVAMPLSEKRRLVSVAARGFLVIAEVGSKSPTVQLPGSGRVGALAGRGVVGARAAGSCANFLLIAGAVVGKVEATTALAICGRVRFAVSGVFSREAGATFA